MKKLLFVAALAGIGIAIYRKMMADAEERELWAEITDSVE